MQGPLCLQASHLRLGGASAPPTASPFRSEYPPHWRAPRPAPILPGRGAGVLNQDLGGPWRPQSEAQAAFPPRPPGPPPARPPPTGPLRALGDPRLRGEAPTTRADFAPPPAPAQRGAHDPRRGETWRDHVPRGDPAQLPRPETLYAESFPPPRGGGAPGRAPCRHLGRDSALRGDGVGRFGTTYGEQFRGAWGPAAQPCSEHMGSVPFGDPREPPAASEQKRAFLPISRQGDRYDPQEAAARIRGTSIPAGDGRQRLRTVMAADFPWRQPGPPPTAPSGRNASSILQGAPGAPESLSTHRCCYTEPRVGAPAQGPPEARAGVRLGDPRFAFFGTSHQAAFRAPPAAPPPPPAPTDLRKSSIVFGWRAPGPPTTSTQDMLAPHRPGRQRLSEEELQKIKHSHLVLPWRQRRWLSTEQKEAYPAKAAGPIVLARGDSQRSSVPLGGRGADPE